MNEQTLFTNGQRVVLLDTYSILAAVSGVTPGSGGSAGKAQLPGMNYAGFEATFVYGAGGTTVKAWVQTSFDGGTNWLDVANFAFTTASLRKVAALSRNIVAAAPATPTTATLADNTINNGLLGDRLRVVVTSTGTYTGTNTLKITAFIGGN